jgi:hypothetical protein
MNNFQPNIGQLFEGPNFSINCVITNQFQHFDQSGNQNSNQNYRVDLKVNIPPGFEDNIIPPKKYTVQELIDMKQQIDQAIPSINTPSKITLNPLAKDFEPANDSTWKKVHCDQKQNKPDRVVKFERQKKNDQLDANKLLINFKFSIDNNVNLTDKNEILLNIRNAKHYFKSGIADYCVNLYREIYKNQKINYKNLEVFAKMEQELVANNRLNIDKEDYEIMKQIKDIVNDNCQFHETIDNCTAAIKNIEILSKKTKFAMILISARLYIKNISLISNRIQYEIQTQGYYINHIKYNSNKIYKAQIDFKRKQCIALTKKPFTGDNLFDEIVHPSLKWS